MSSNISLPAPHPVGGVSLESAFLERRSARAFSPRPLPLVDLAHLLWAGQGVTHPDGYRTVPSAGGLHPLRLHVATGAVTGLKAGLYRYFPQRHALQHRGYGDMRAALAEAALGQEWVANAAAVIIITAEYALTTDKYGDRGIQYVYLEAGAAAQNVQLQATAHGLGSVLVGAFDDEQVWRILDLQQDEQALVLLPVGRRT